MIAAWMLYCSLCALGLFLAASLAERALLGGRGAVRLVWVGAVALSLLVPLAALRFAARPGAADTAVSLSGGVPDGVLDASPPIAAVNMELPRVESPRRSWRAVLARFDGGLAIAWVTLSLALALDFFGGIVTLAWMRRRWQRREVLGVPVFVSERTGPAVVGVVAPAIVVPEWVLSMEPAQLALMLRHEQEHQRAGDGRLLTAAKLALVVMPWNLALWWQLLRLRVAVELDCDARVLQDADARSYGDLLLQVALPRRGRSLMGATAFAERATQLERRIRLLARHRVRTSRAARAVATCIGLTAVTVAWVAPRPPAPARAPASSAAQALGITPVRSEMPAPAAPPTLSTAAGNTGAAPAGKSEAPGAPREEPAPTRNVTDAAGTTRSLLSAAAQCTRREAAADVRSVVDTVFARLFEGIALSRSQEARVCDILTTLQQEQLVQDLAASVSQITEQVRRTALQVRRDSALRALLEGDADRALLDERLARAPGPRGRTGGPPPDLTAGGRRGGGGGGGERVGGGARRGGGGGGDTLGMRVGRGGQRGDLRLYIEDIRAVFDSTIAEATFHRLFEGIPLTAEQESRARRLIHDTQKEMRPQVTLAAQPRLRLDPVSGMVTMPAESADELSALLGSDADRALLRSRILVVPR